MFESGRSLTYELANELGFAIINGDFSPADKFLTEIEISQKYNVSKNVVRESIKILHAKGLLNSNSRVGITLAPSESWSLFDSQILAWILRSNSSYTFLVELVALQTAIEPEAARLAALNFRDLKRSNAIAKTLKEIESSEFGSESLICAEIDFHIAILNLCNNPYFIQMHKIIEVSTRLRYTFLNQSKVKVKLRYQYHHKIYDAIVRGDAELAAKLSRGLMKVFSVVVGTINPQHSNTPKQITRQPESLGYLAYSAS